MGGAKETLGYPSRTAAVMALRAQGLSPRAVADRIGIPVKSVAALECSATRAPAVAPQRGGGIPISYDLRCALRPHARRREIAVETLALRVLETVAYGKLVDAVLDDEEEMV